MTFGALAGSAEAEVTEVRVGNASVNDTYYAQNFDTNGAETTIVARSLNDGFNKGIYARFNFTGVIPSDALVINATVVMTKTAGAGTVSAFNVTDWFSNIGWMEYVSHPDTGTTLPCGNPAAGAVVFNSSCNQTALDSSTGSTWVVTDAVQSVMGGSQQVVTFAFNQTDGASSDITFHSKESATAGARPYLRIFYEDFVPINLTTFNLTNTGNGTSLDGFGIYATNGTAFYQEVGMSAGAQVDNRNLPLGSGNVTFFRNGFQNATVNATILSTANGTVSASAWRLQEFRATNDAGGAVSPFQIVATNGTFSTGTLSSSGGRVVVSLGDMPFGTTTFTATAGGYATNVTSLSVGGSSELNASFLMPVSRFTIVNVFDERSGDAICYNFTLSNGSSTYSDSSCGIFQANTTQVPTGSAVQLTITNQSYWPRTYLPTITQSSATNVTGYLVLIEDGYVVRFHMVDFFGVPVTGGTAYASSVIGGSTVPVAQTNADGTGTVSIFMDPLRTYSLVFTAPGYSNVSQTLQPTSQDYDVVMGEVGGNVTGAVTSQYLWSVQASGGIYSNDTLIPINFTYVDYANITTYFGLNVTYNGTLLFSQINSTSGGSIVVYVSTVGRPGLITAQAFALRDVPGLLSQTYFYQVLGVDPSTGLNFGNFPGFSSITDATAESGLGHPFTDIAALFVVVLVMAGFSRLPWHLTGASMIGLVILGAFIYIGWVSFSSDPVWGPTITWGTYLAFWVSAVMVMFVIRRL